MRKISYDTITRKGPSHTKNQDSLMIYYNRFKRLGFLLICDGIGGYFGGDVASKIASEIVYKNFIKKDKEVSWHNWMIATIKEIKVEFISAIKKNSMLKEMSTTLCLAIVDTKHKKVLVMNLGDSMCMVYNKNGQKHQLVNQHTFYNYLVRTKQDIEKAKAEKGEAYLHSLVNFVAANSPAEIWFDEIEYDLQDDDVLIVCSDGIYKFLSVENFIFKNKTPKDICKLFLNNAIENSTTDDASIGVMKYEIK